MHKTNKRMIYAIHWNSLFVCSNMILPIILVTFFSLSASKSYHAQNRIVGGIPVDGRPYPFMASIQLNGSHICGGTIYNQNLIITSAHCLTKFTYEDLPQIKVLVGTNSLLATNGYQSVIALYIHRFFNADTYENDVAAIQLTNNLTFSDQIKPVTFANPSDNDLINSVLIGWGYIQSFGGQPADLLYLNVSIVAMKDCISFYPSTKINKTSNYCTSSPDGAACYGDSGGPLLYQGSQIGILSFSRGCSTIYPNVYMKYSAFEAWFQKVSNMAH